MIGRIREAAETRVRAERRRSPRRALACAATVRAGELSLEGEIRDLSEGGVFVATKLLIEIGEHGVLEIGGEAIAIAVVWLRGCADGDGPGMGLAFQTDGPTCARFHRRLAGG